MDDIQWGETTEDLTIAIYVDNPVYKPGETIVLNILLKNVGEMPLPLVIRSPWLDYNLRAWHEDSTEMSKTPYALRVIKVATVGRRAVRQLMPEEVITDTLEIDKVYDMSALGSYKIAATRETFKKQNSDEFATVESNELIIKIAEEDGEER